ncbi:histidine kinase N-terminal 7TM domain-containing protein [Bacillus sp. AK128]
MNQEIYGYVVATVLGGILSLLLCIYAYVNIKNSPGGKYYILATFMASFFTFSYAQELLSTNLEQILFWVKMEYLALPFIPVFIFLMCMDFVGKRPNRLVTVFLYGVPLLTITLQLTNDFHHLYYKSTSLRSDTAYPIAQLEGGPGFLIHSLFLYGLVTASIIILLMEFKTVSSKFKIQLLLLMFGVLVPIISSVFYIMGLSPNGIDVGPVSMCVSFVFHGIALLSFKTFDIAPIARDRVFESINEGVLVLNMKNVLIDYNPSMQQVLPTLKPISIGKPIKDVLNGNPEVLHVITREIESDYQSTQNGQTYYHEVKFSPVLNKKGVQIGKIISFMNVTNRVLLEAKLKKTASIDGLTNIYNRSFFIQESEKYVNRGAKVSILMFDIDHFKRVNDTYGHANGDKVLCHVVDVVKNSIDEKSIFGRFGGEEFLVCIPDASLEDALITANKIRLNIESSYIKINNQPIFVTSSFGIATSGYPQKNHSIQELIQLADQALYLAKGNGRNCAVPYTPLVNKVH